LRSVHPFNQDWLYLPEDAAANRPDHDFERVTLPHTNIILPYHNFDNTDYQFISTYRKRFRLPEPRQGRRVYIDFDGAMIACTVSLNGHVLGDYEGGFTPFSFDLTDYLKEDGDNLLTVRLDSTERPDIPPYGGVVDYLTFGGIYRDVSLRYVEPVHIVNVFAWPTVGTIQTREDGSRFSADATLTAEVTLTNQSAQPAQRALVLALPTDNEFSELVTVELKAGETRTVTVPFDNLGEIEVWTLDFPALYEIELHVFAGEITADTYALRVGFRQAEFRDDGFYLNGERLSLIGLNRHQTYPYIGAAAPKRLQEKDADIVKFELGCNIVRTSHYPQSPHFIRRCDEIGLLVFEEIPGWQHIGDEDWQGISLRDVEAMILRDRNHPSIVLWGVRINESLDNHAFYTRTNELAHKLDPTRQTGGVRYWQHSEFLEDVYTFNDFSNDVQEPVQTPHLITEFNGHMFPTKSFDQEERAVEHALRHARIQDKQMGMANVSGAIGWCAFDYNTHKEFGSGDRICYHGVMDIFRLPKFAASFYESQISPTVRPVLRAATYWTMGDRSGGGINPLVVFSNCDEVELFTGSQRIGLFLPDREQFPHLPHAPIFIRGLNLLWGGHKFDDLRLVGYVNGQAVIEQMISANGIPDRLLLSVDDPELIADGADMTRLIFKITDQYGNRLPYATQIVSFEIDGPAQLIGENPFALVGGQAALYIKAGHEPGTVTVRASTPRLAPAEITITLTGTH
jgi:beta-galactosidase